MNKIVQFALIGAAVGLVLAHVFPGLGRGDFETGLNNLAYSLGKSNLI